MGEGRCRRKLNVTTKCIKSQFSRLKCAFPLCLRFLLLHGTSWSILNLLYVVNKEQHCHGCVSEAPKLCFMQFTVYVERISVMTGSAFHNSEWKMLHWAFEHFAAISFLGKIQPQQNICALGRAINELMSRLQFNI